MIKNIKSAILLGLSLYAIIFVVVSLILFIPKLGDIAWLRWGLDWLFVGVAAFFISKMYFQKNPGSVLDGIVVSVFWISIMTVLDLFITVPLFIRKQVADDLGRAVTYSEAAGVFFYEWQLWVGFLIIVVVTVIVSRGVSTNSAEMPNRFLEQE